MVFLWNAMYWVTEVINLVREFELIATSIMHILHMKVSLVSLLGRTRRKH